jgi:hypothetical protein
VPRLTGAWREQWRGYCEVANPRDKSKAEQDEQIRDTRKMTMRGEGHHLSSGRSSCSTFANEFTILAML